MKHGVRGVTLLELVFVMAILGTAVAFIGGAMAGAFKALPLSQGRQSAAQALQACAESLLRARRTTGFSFGTAVGALVSAHCPAEAGVPAVTLADAVTPPGAEACPAGLQCRHLVLATAEPVATLDLLLVQPAP
jgi:prepilin-type N-terminal cleavage/methylation domain-containing protein